MSRLFLGAVAALALAATWPAVAQLKGPDKGAEKAATDKQAAIPKGVFYKGQGPTQYLARTRLLGQNVYNKDGARLGDIEDLILGKDNQIDGVIIGVGGFLGVGEKKIGVRYGAFKFETKDGKTVISLPMATKEMLAGLEPYKRTESERTLLDKAKELGGKASDAAKDLAKRAGEAVKGGGKQ